ncbi:MAG: hypothetical protein O7C66_00695 [Alphaproteobacteria bacterium]|nr:hypothetical protein [Alphaproteobacteria bacterium]
MAVDNLLAPSPLNVTSQIVQTLSQKLEQVRENVDKVLLEGEDKADQTASRPESQPVGSAQPSSEDNGLGQGSSDGNEAEGGNTTPTRGNTVNTSA